ncbi:hypothetical protein [[Mycobacterium] burgundiense]|uniref:Uncharacterized protein n=1 Tax=[Mycobacterium] burgundiense TaxID=3064286 RepID=A0ABM9M4T8_9MYCO|nr:hypothetical protein [Mycolicibacterium sp. MU0053]CAJ1510182.1 hypothetical protein MU0053_004483 [Mycolicibacterium sp. MU0053]
MPNSDPLPQADPADVAAQAAAVEDPAHDDEPVTEVPLETDPVDYSEQREVVDLSDDGYPDGDSDR